MAQKIKLASLKTDRKKEDEGDWVESLAYPGVRYLMRSLNSSDYRLALNLAMKRLAQQYGRQPIPQDEAIVVVGGLMAKHLLKDWDGFDPAYSPEVAADTLSDIEFRDLISDIEQSATQVARSKIEYVEDTAKN